MTLPWLRPPRLYLLLALALALLLLWCLGPWLGLASASSRLAAILLVLLAAVSLAHLSTLRAARAQDEPAGPSPWAAAIRTQILRAVRTLRTSHLGRLKGRHAVHELPWLLVLGHAGSGKSEAIRQSGLTFPLAQPEGAGLDGLGPLRFAFATEGVLLEAPGEAGAPDQGPEAWQEGLRILRRHRPGGPLEGILATVDAAGLQAPGTLAARAQELRRRLSGLEHLLGQQLPVYLLFTRMDLLPGFTSFFEDLTGDERRAAWGASLPQDQGPAFDLQEAVARHLALLHQGLAERGVARLALLPAQAHRPSLTTFPVAFRRLGAAVQAFTGHLAGDDPYHARPFLRGFYFASALQAPGPGSELLLEAFDLAAPAHASAAGVPGPCFLEDLFRRIIFPDRFLATHLAAPRRAWPRLAQLGAGLALLAVLAGGMAWSFMGNRRLQAAVRAEQAQAGALAAAPQLENRLEGLMVLQLRLEQLDRHRRHGAPWALRWGLYQGRTLEQELRRQYFAGVTELMLGPVQRNLEELLARASRSRLPAAPVRQPRPARPRPLPRPLPPEPQEQLLRVLHLTHGQSCSATPPREAPATVRPARTDPGAEHLYQALKTYLMLGDRSRMDPGHLADHLPRHWRPFLEGRGARSASPSLMRAAERTVAFYVAQAASADLPVIEVRPALVEQARRHLRATARLLSPLEQVYGELKARANAEFEPMTLERLLKNQDLDLITAGHAIPGSFTREAYERYFRAALQDPGLLGDTDWVLATARRPAGNPANLQHDLEALYKAEYARHWEAFLQSVQVLGFGSLEGAAAALARLGDAQQSPLKLLLTRAGAETAWDNPTVLEHQLQQVKSGVLARTGKLLGPRPAPRATVQHGALGSRFSALLVVTTPGEGSPAPLDGYLQLLHKTRTRLGALAQAGDPYAGARELLQATLLGAGSELAEAQQYLEATLLPRTDGPGREVLRTLLARPLVQTCATLAASAEQDLNRAWAQQVWAPWNALAASYPFADAGAEAPMAELQRFLKPGDGILPGFVDKYLGPLVAFQGGTLTPRHWAGRGVAFREDFLQGVGRLCQAAAFLRDPAVAQFELQPVPTPGLSELLLEIDGQRLQYRNGPQGWTTFSWPGQSGLQGARLQVVAVNGAPLQVQTAPGRLGLLRLFEQARRTEPATGAQVLEWPLQPPRGPELRIRFNFRMVSGPDPLRLTALRHQALPSRVTY
jgi:type VI secretion system protein ImpL